MTLARELAAFCTSLRYGDVPPAARPFIRSGFADCFGALVAGRDTETARILHGVTPGAAGDCRVLIDRGSAAPADAALVNACAAHALDFDDAAQKGHISAVLVPAILAEAEARGSSGPEMLAAYAAGYETWAELLRREPDPHHNHSWHPTGMFGPVAVAAACASLAQLDAQRAAHALCIAASFAGGLIANFGSMTKPLHAARASQAGVLAVRFAAAGLTASPDALEHPKGLLKGISPNRRVDVAATSEAGRVWKLPVAGVSIKKYPICFAAHRATDGMLELVAEHGLTTDQVREVTVTTSRRNRSTLRFWAPADALQAKFSMEFAMACALIRKRCTLQELSDEFVQREEVRSLMHRVQVVPEDREDPARAGEAMHDIVVVETMDGQRLRCEVDYARGGPEKPLLAGELEAKFTSCIAYGRLAADPKPLFQALMAIDELPGTQALYELTTRRHDA